jgi:hypothetical protein
MALRLPSAANNAGIFARRTCPPGRVRILLALCAHVILACPLLLFCAASPSPGAESSPQSPPAGKTELTNAHEAIAAFLRLQGQLHATQLAVERSLQETKAAVAQNAAAWSNGLQSVQETLAVQRARDREALQKSNRFMLLVVGTLAAGGFCALLLVAYFQWCMSRGLAEIAAALPTAPRLVHRAALDALGPEEQAPLPLLDATEPPEQPRREPDQASPSGSRPRRGIGRSIERRLFPKPGDSLRRRQFRALKVALLFGLIFAAAMALGLYLMYKGLRT